MPETVGPATVGEVPEAEVVELVSERSREICQAVETLDAAELEHPSALPEWTRLTIVCHLRYGAQATRQMTEAALGGRPSAFYPGGRDLQRPYTLRPALGEAPLHVVESLVEECEALTALWSGLSALQWTLVAREHDETRSLGDPTLADLARLRLTEVQVHGSDLDLGLSPWPASFGRAVLAQRVDRVRLRDELPPGIWLLSAADDGDHVVRRSAVGPPDVRFRASANDLVALLVGREPAGTVDIEGDAVLAAAFVDAIVGP